MTFKRIRVCCIRYASKFYDYVIFTKIPIINYYQLSVTNLFVAWQTNYYGSLSLSFFCEFITPFLLSLDQAAWLEGLHGTQILELNKTVCLSIRTFNLILGTRMLQSSMLWCTTKVYTCSVWYISYIRFN